MVSFEMDEDQRILKDSMSGFAADLLRPASREADETGDIPEEIIQKGWELGIQASTVPEEYGGYGGSRSLLSGVIGLEELAWGDLSLALHLCAPSLFTLPLLEMGTEAQKEKYLRAFCGESYKAATMAVMEPFFDFDLASLRTTATQDGKGYVLNGHKCFVPLAKQSEWILVFASLNPGTGYAGVEGFFVEKGTMGLKVEDREKNMGLKALETHEVLLTDCRVPPENRLGGARGSSFLALMSYGKIALTAAAVGMGRAAFEYSRDYAKERYAFGEPIASRQSIAFMIAEMAIEIDATRLMLWEAAWRYDQGQDGSHEAYMAKQYAADMIMKVTDHAVQVLGGHGYIREHPVELWLRNARGFATFEGLAIV